MVIHLNFEIGPVEYEILSTALYSLKTETLCHGDVPRSEVIQALINKLGMNHGD